jgi:hypothetical protein
MPNESLALQPIARLTDAELETDLLATGQRILGLRKKGFSHYEISRELDIPVSEVTRIEEKTRDKIFCTIAPEIEHDRHLAVAQLNDVIRSLREIADHSYDYTERIGALNGITKAILAKSKVIGFETQTITHNNLNIDASEFVKQLAIYNGKPIK